jgi:hypothetical protein
MEDNELWVSPASTEEPKEIDGAAVVNLALNGGRNCIIVT